MTQGRGRTSLFVVFDRLQFEGRLAALLAGWRADGLSFQEITRRLETESGGRVVVDPSTARNWCDRPEVKAAAELVAQAS